MTTKEAAPLNPDAVRVGHNFPGIGKPTTFDVHALPSLGEPQQETVYQPPPKPRDPLLQEVERLRERKDTSAIDCYIATVKAFVSGSATAPEIDTALQASGKTLDDLEHDADLWRDHLRMEAVIATEPQAQAERERLQAEWEKIEQTRQDRLRELRQAERQYSSAENAAARARAALEDQGRTFDAIKGARVSLASDPRFDLFRTKEEREQNARKVEHSRKLNAARDRLSELHLQIGEEEEHIRAALEGKAASESYAEHASKSANRFVTGSVPTHRKRAEFFASEARRHHEIHASLQSQSEAAEHEVAELEAQQP